MRSGRSGALVSARLLAGGILTGTIAANAAGEQSKPQRSTVEVGEDFAVSGVQTGGPGGHRGEGHCAPDAGTTDGAATTGETPSA